MYSLNHSSITNEPADQPEEASWYTPQGEGVSVHTGFPNPGIDPTQRGLDLNRLLIQHSSGTYLMRIAGDEWQHCGIFDGDIALIDRVLDPVSQDLVIWWYDGDFTISERRRMRPEATVWGVVTATIHPLRLPATGGHHA